MPRIETTVSCPVFDSFRVQQVSGLLDVPLSERAAETFSVEVPDLADDWQIGAIVGPSGSGKSTIAREAFGNCIYAAAQWPAKAALVDGFPPEIPIKDLTAMLTSVGFSSPPAWLKPYHVLSNGQKFRADLARALLGGDGVRDRAGEPKKSRRKTSSSPTPTPSLPRLVVFDEFTSVVDRTVAKVGSLAVGKTIRRTPGLKFVAVACHYDILEWLAPDWVLDMQSQSLARGTLWQRPPIELELHRAQPRSWQLFKPHHYLSANVPSAARYYLASLKTSEPVALVVVGNFFGTPKLLRGQVGRRLISRIVVLPDYQGIGIAGHLLDAVAQLLTEERYQVTIRSGHPGMLKLLERSPHWRITRWDRLGLPPVRKLADGRQSMGGSLGRPTASATFLG